jgi:hypothetical protein
VVRVAPRPKAETAVEKVRFENSLQYARNRSLQQPVCDGGDAQRPRSALASISLANCSMLCPSIPLAALWFSIPQVSLRKAGVSRWANEVKRTFRSSFAFFAI